MKVQQLYKLLEKELAKSTGQDRMRWAQQIIDEPIPLIELIELLQADSKTALRFQWLLSDVAHLDKNRFKLELPLVFEAATQLGGVKTRTEFATYWSICGIPEPHEAEAIDTLFYWIGSPHINVTLKSRAINAILQVLPKYPELTNELKLHVEEQIENYTPTFKKKVTKILFQIGHLD